MRLLPIPMWLLNMRLRAELVFRLFSTRERILLVALIITLIASAIFTGIGYVRRNTTLIPQPGGIYTEAVVGEPRYINPVLAGTNDIDLDLANIIYSSLFQLNNKLELVGDLATGYDISENGLEYTVYLRNDVLWHDGQPFGADDVVFTIRSIQTPDYGSPLASSFQGVRVEKKDDVTVIFKLSQPYAPFLKNLIVGITPKHVWESVEPKNATLAEQILKPIGTGPFKFKEITTRRKTGEVTSFRMVRNDRYYRQKPFLDEIVFHFYLTNEEAVRALLSGTVDGISFLPLQLKEEVASRRSLTVRRLLIPQYFGLFFNEIKNDILGDAGVRAALALAVDREKIVQEALAGEARSLHVPIPRGLFSFNGEVNEPTFDPEVAKQNLEDAGWKDENNDGVREKEGKQLTLTITTTDWPEFMNTAQLIKEAWNTIGVSVKIENIGAGAIQQTAVGPRDYEVLLYGEILQSDPDPYPFWHSTQTRSPGLNLALFKDEQVDKLLEEARKTNDIEQRKEKYLEFLQRFFDLNPAIILYQPYYLFAHNKDVRGQSLEEVNLPVSRFNDIENWHVNVKRAWNR